MRGSGLGRDFLPGRASADPDRIDYSTEQVLSEKDSAEVVAEKAAKVLPRPNQSAWMRLEQTYLIHFGPNSFRGVEWGNGRENPSVFNPTALDAEQWVKTIKDAGGTMVILVAKHHEGMSLWPTRYSGHSVAASPWSAGKGDLVREGEWLAGIGQEVAGEPPAPLSPADLRVQPAAR